MLHHALRASAAQLGGWTPADFGTDLVAWWKADAGVTESGGAVSQWDDQSGNGWHLTQGTSGSRPIYSATGFNSSYPGITFDGTDDFLAVSSVTGLSGASACSVFVVMRWDETLSDAYARIFSFWDADYANGYGNANSFIIQRENLTSNIQFGGNSAYTSTTVTDDTNYRLGGVWDGSNVTLYKNNVASTPTSKSMTLSGPATIRISKEGSGGGTAYVSGIYAEVFVLKKAPDSTERSTIDSYFTTTWGL